MKYYLTKDKVGPVLFTEESVFCKLKGKYKTIEVTKELAEFIFNLQNYHYSFTKDFISDRIGV